MLFSKNYQNNCKVELPDGYLNGQSLGTLGEMRFGAKTMDDAGCGPLSIYNAMQYLNRPMPLPKIIRELEIYAAPLGARFGTSGLLMTIFLLRHHIRFRFAWRIKSIDRSKAGILLFWTKRPVFSGGHFVFYKKEEDGRIAVYNRYSNRDSVYRFSSMREVVPQSRICMVFALK